MIRRHPLSHPLESVMDNRVTLCLTARSGSVSLKGQNLLCSSARELPDGTLPLERLRRVLIIGRCRLTLPLIQALLRSGVPIDLLSVTGDPVGHFHPAALTATDRDLSKLPSLQNALCHSPRALTLAKLVIAAKVSNCVQVLQNNHLPSAPLSAILNQLPSCADLDTLRGHEGQAARLYFAARASRLPKDLHWQGRFYHPAPDPINALLSLAYTLLYNRMLSALRSQGLNPLQGFFHQGRGTHAALASDLMEPYRCLVDSVVFRLLNRRQIRPKHFRTRPGPKPSCVLNDHNAFNLLVSSCEECFAQVIPLYGLSTVNLSAATAPPSPIKHTLNNHLDDLAHLFVRLVRGDKVCLPLCLSPLSFHDLRVWPKSR